MAGSGPRARTLAKMKLMLGGVALGAACSDGYAVVDPMPPPARCESPISQLTGNARFEKQTDGTFHLVALVVPPEKTDLRFSQTAAPSSPGQKLTHRIDQNGLELRTPITPVEKEFHATVQIECADGPASVNVAAFWSEGDPAAGSVVPLQIADQRGGGYRGGAD